MATEYWTKGDGTKISVDDMSIDHLRNTLKMLIRNNRNKKKSESPITFKAQRSYPIFNLNGEMAQASIDDHYGPDEGDGPDWDQGCRD